MKRWISGSLMVLFLAPVAVRGEEGEASSAGELEGLEQRTSYALGLSFGRSVREQGVGVDLDLLIRGLTTGLEGGEASLTDEEIQSTMRELQQEVMARRRAKQETMLTENLAAGEKFLEENGAREGVVALPSGLQYEVLRAGDGERPEASDRVTVHYRGTLLDGTTFDSSYDRGSPATFGLDRVIKGWTEGLALMPVGSKWKLFIPADLGYGDRGSGANIPPNSALVFEVELLGIEGTPEPQEPETAVE